MSLFDKVNLTNLQKVMITVVFSVGTTAVGWAIGISNNVAVLNHKADEITTSLVKLSEEVRVGNNELRLMVHETDKRLSRVEFSLEKKHGITMEALLNQE